MTSLKAMKGNNDHSISLNSMILLSFLLHALVLSIVFLSPSWPQPKWTFGPVYTVDLISLPANFVEAKKIASPSEEIIGIGSRDQSVVIKKRIDKFSTTPINRMKTHKKVLNGDVDKAIEDIRKRTLPSKEGSRQVLSRGDVEMTMKMKVYYSIIWSRIREQWALPEGILPQDNFEAIIAVKILRNGAVADLDFEKRSGNRYFDESAVKAVKKGSPFPPLPEWMRESNIEVGVRFRSSELR